MCNPLTLEQALEIILDDKKSKIMSELKHYQDNFDTYCYGKLMMEFRLQVYAKGNVVLDRLDDQHQWEEEDTYTPFWSVGWLSKELDLEQFYDYLVMSLLSNYTVSLP